MAPSSSALRSRASSTASSLALAMNCGIGELGVHLADLAFRLFDLAAEALASRPRIDDAGQRQGRRGLADDDHARRPWAPPWRKVMLSRRARRLIGLLVPLGALAQRRRSHPAAPAGSWRRPARSSPCAPSGSRVMSRTTQPISSSASASTRPESTGHWLSASRFSRFSPCSTSVRPQLLGDERHERVQQLQDLVEHPGDGGARLGLRRFVVAR